MIQLLIYKGQDEPAYTKKTRKRSIFFDPSYFYYICVLSALGFDPMGVGWGPDSSSIATWGDGDCLLRYSSVAV